MARGWRVCARGNYDSEKERQVRTEQVDSRLGEHWAYAESDGDHEDDEIVWRTDALR